MLNTLFEIGNHNAGKPSLLLLEIGETFISKALIDTTTKRVEALHVFSFDFIELEESLSSFLDALKKEGHQFERVVIAAAFPEALLVPQKFYKDDNALLKGTYGLNGLHCLHDSIPEWQLINSYAVPIPIYKLVQQAFPDAIYIHSYTPALKVFNGVTSEHQVDAYFIGSRFRVVVKKHQQIQLVQTYSYTSPMDVVYYLLKIYAEFHLPQEETHMIISGFIAEESPLYKELYNYFLNLYFSTASIVTLPDSDHPPHFFTYLHNLAACVL